MAERNGDALPPLQLTHDDLEEPADLAVEVRELSKLCLLFSGIKPQDEQQPVQQEDGLCLPYELAGVRSILA